MTQDAFTTKPIGAPARAASTVELGSGADATRGRRRLGSWQTAAIDAATAGLAHDLDNLGATRPIEANPGSGPLSNQTAPMAPHASAATGPMQTGTATVELAPGQATAAIKAPRGVSTHGGSFEAAFTTEHLNGHDGLPTTALGTSSGETAGLPTTAPIATASRKSSSTAVTPAGSGTVPIASPTDSLPAPHEPEVVLGAAEAAAIGALRERVRANPGDADALFELSVMLHRAGLRQEAREVLARLVTVYEQRGQQAQAERIRVMLGTPKTGPIKTDDLPPRPANATAALRGKTGGLRKTGSLPHTGPFGRSARAKAAAEDSAPVAPFPPDSLQFSVPLPGEDALPPDIREIVRSSGEELVQQHYKAAHDSCILAIGLAPDFTPLHLRLAEIYTRQRHTRRARAQAEALLRLADATGQREELWRVYRVLLHASETDLASLRRLVELLIEKGQVEQATLYASRLVQLLDSEGLATEAATYSASLCDMAPGDTRAALENAVLRLKDNNQRGAMERWEAAVEAGADPYVARASVAAMLAGQDEEAHWRTLAEVMPIVRASKERSIVDAYVRTAQVVPANPALEAGQGLLLTAVGDKTGRERLAAAAGDRAGSPISRATASVALAWSLAETGQVDEHVAALRTALGLLADESLAALPYWEGLAGSIPRYEGLGLELGEILLSRGDSAGAAEVLQEAHLRARHHGPVCERLAEAYFKTGQLGSALTVLDELAVHYRGTGQLEAMAGVLRQMSQLAPNNIKVKSRLIDAYLQRGFVAEARAELIQRADLEERSGLIKDCIASLQRAADLSWTIGQADETFSLYNRIIALAPEDISNRSALVNLYLLLNRFTEAAEHQRAVADIALRGDRTDEKIAALHQVIGLTPEDTTAYYQLGDLLGTIGEYRQAERVYRRLLLLNPDDAIAQAKATAMQALKEGQAR